MTAGDGYRIDTRLQVCVRFLRSLTALAAIVVGLPAALVVACRVGLDAAHPFPGLGSSDEVGDFLRRGLSPAEVTPIVLRTLLIVGWVVWLGLVWSVGAAVIDTRRGGDFDATRWVVFEGVGRRIVAGLTSLSMLAPSVVAATSAAAPGTATASQAVMRSSVADEMISSRAPLRPGFARVQRCESIEMLAQRVLGDGSRWPEIWDLNRNHRVGEHGETWSQVWRLSAGWHLRVPPASCRATRADSVGLSSWRRVEPHGSSFVVTASPARSPSGVHPVGGDNDSSRQARAGLDTVNRGRDVKGPLADFHTVGSDPALHQEPAGEPGLGVVAPAVSRFPRADEKPGQDGVTPPGDDGGVPVHEVEPGESYWAIAQDTLGEHALAGEVLALTNDLMDLNAPRLGYADRAMIHPGDVVYLQDPATVAAPIPAASSDDEPPGTAVPGANETVSPEPASEAAQPVPTTDELPVVSTEPAPEDAPVHGGEGSSVLSRPGALVAGIAGTVLAAGLASRAVWLRRRRITRGALYAHLTAGSVEREVFAAADVSLVRWAGSQLTDLVRRLDPRAVTAGPVAVELSEGAGIEVLWERAQLAPTPSGWSSADGGWAWRRRYDPDELVAPADGRVGIPGLVTIGRRQGRQLLVDLEAFDVLAVSGPEGRVDAFLRSVATELAVGSELSDAQVSTTGVAMDLAAGLDRLTVGDVDGAVARLNEVRHEIGGLLDAAGMVDTFHARCHHRAIEAVVAVAGRLGCADSGRVAASIEPRCGVGAVVATDAPPAAGAYVRLDDDGTARLEPLGITFAPAGLDHDESDRIGVMLDELADLPDTPDDTTKVRVDSDHEWSVESAVANGQQFTPWRPADRVPPDVTVGAADDETSCEIVGAVSTRPDSPAAFADHASAPVVGLGADGGAVDAVCLDEASMVVRVLGVPSIPQRPELLRRELILAVLLACRGGRLAATAAQDALWGGKPVEAKTVWNLVARTRRGLGVFADGRAVMPAADRARGTLCLDAQVTVDVDTLVEGVERARQLPSSQAIGVLRDCLGLVQGPPFDAAGYDWAHRDQDVAYASTAIEQAAEGLVRLALESDLVDVAREAITRGLRGLPGNEVLYRWRMRVEHHAHNPAAIVAAYDELGVYLADLDAEVSPATTALYHKLTARRAAG